MGNVVNDFNVQYFEESKFNLENFVPYFSSLNLNDMIQDDNLKQEAINKYEEYMSVNGSYGTIFELNAAAKYFGFVGSCFIYKENKFDCIKIGYSNDANDELKPKIFVLFNFATINGHFRILKPFTVISVKIAKNLPHGQYSVINENDSYILIAKCDQNIITKTKATSKGNISSNNSTSLMCPLCQDSSKHFKSQHGPKIHFSRKHSGEDFETFLLLRHNMKMQQTSKKGYANCD